jgi:hypothetical protein
MLVIYRSVSTLATGGSIYSTSPRIVCPYPTAYAVETIQLARLVSPFAASA